MACEMEFDFEELTPILEDTLIKGMALFGTAHFTDDGNDPGDFYITEIVLDGLFRLNKSGSAPFGVPSDLRKTLFKALETQLMDGKTDIGRSVLMEWGEAFDASRHPDPDHYYDERRERQMEACL